MPKSMFTPAHTLLTVVMEAAQKKTAGGIDLPPDHERKTDFAVVQAVSPVIASDECSLVRPGVRVLVLRRMQPSKVGGRQAMVHVPYPPVNDGGVACVLCDHSDIIGVIHEQTAPEGQETTNEN